MPPNGSSHISFLYNSCNKRSPWYPHVVWEGASLLPIRRVHAYRGRNQKSRCYHEPGSRKMRHYSQGRERRLEDSQSPAMPYAAFTSQMMLKIECTGLGSIHAAIQVPYRTVGQNKICVSLFELFSCTNIGKAITMTVFSSHQYFIGWVLVLLFVPETKALTLEASRTVLFFIGLLTLLYRNWIRCLALIRESMRANRLETRFGTLGHGY